MSETIRDPAVHRLAEQLCSDLTGHAPPAAVLRAADRMGAFLVERERGEGDSLPRRVHPESEITRDPIFLLQRRRWMFREIPPGWEIVDDVIHEEANNDHYVDLSYDACNKQFGEDCLVSWWDTELVFFTRDEGEAYGHEKAYNYADGWRVYCVCAQGELAKLLKAATSRPERKESTP